jgi:hypothetical protein
MSWREEMQRDIAGYIIREGGEPVESDSVYGWKDYDADQHVKGWGDGCEWVAPDHPEVSTNYISEFDGADVPSLRYKVLDVYGVSCKCGKYSDMTLRLKGETVLSIIQDLIFTKG